MTSKSLFIAIEGGDGSGKGTQTELLSEYFTSKLKKDVLKQSFPRYDKESSYYVSQYLNGVYNEDPNKVPADLASLAYAIDRYAAGEDIRKHLKKPDGVVIADRYVASNLAHQGTKFNAKKERLSFYDRMLATEYQTLGIPKPTINIVLLMPANLAQSNVDKKSARAYTTKKRDIHEQDANHLERAKANYEELCELYPDEFIPIQCVDANGDMKSIDTIQAEIRKKLEI